MNETKKLCPILHTAHNPMMNFCIGKRCAWWCDFAKSCSIPLIAGMFADSSICNNVWEEDGETDG